MVFFGRVMASSVLIAFASSAWASESGKIQIAGVKSLTPPSVSQVRAAAAEPRNTAYVPIEIGGTLPLKYMMVVNLWDYDLPRPRDGWVYFEVDEEIYRVDLNSREILELVARRIR